MKNDDKLFLGGHLVAFIDILGQSEQLEALENTQWWKGDDQTRTILKRTYGRVVRFRKDIADLLDGFSAPQDQAPLEAIITPEERPLLEAIATVEFKQVFIGDSAIVTVPLATRGGAQPLRSIFYVLNLCQHMLLRTLAQGFCIRGAVEIGPCVEDPRTGELYGRALSNAVKLEKQADYHRIVVGPKLLRYLHETVPVQGSRRLIDAHKFLATVMLRMICEDDDKHWMVDFLGALAQANWRESDAEDTVLRKVEAFVADQCANAEHSENVKEKYRRLFKYMQPRIARPRDDIQ